MFMAYALKAMWAFDLGPQHREIEMISCCSHFDFFVKRLIHD